MESISCSFIMNDENSPTDVLINNAISAVLILTVWLCAIQLINPYRNIFCKVWQLIFAFCSILLCTMFGFSIAMELLQNLTFSKLWDKWETTLHDLEEFCSENCIMLLVFLFTVLLMLGIVLFYSCRKTTPSHNIIIHLVSVEVL